MYQKADFGYLETDEAQILELPYKGDDLSMVVVLPTGQGVGSLQALERSLTPEILDILARHDVEVAIEVHSDEIGKQGGAPETVTKLLNGRGVRVWAWFLLDGPKGPFASDVAAEEYYELWRRFQVWAAEKQLDFHGIAGFRAG